MREQRRRNAFRKFLYPAYRSFRNDLDDMIGGKAE